MIVSGGRGLGAGGIRVIAPAGRHIGGAVGARARRWMPEDSADIQVGQTGTTVGPALQTQSAFRRGAARGGIGAAKQIGAIIRRGSAHFRMADVASSLTTGRSFRTDR